MKNASFETTFAAAVAKMHSFKNPADTAFFTDVMDTIRDMHPQAAIAYKNAAANKYRVNSSAYRISFNSSKGCSIYYA